MSLARSTPTSGSKTSEARPSTVSYGVAPGERVYAIGDIHGRHDLLQQLVGEIRSDNAARAAALTKIVILGDFIDRGPQSAEIVQRLMRYTKASANCVVLLGNHEQTMLAALDGHPQALRAWLRLGGAETLRSWGVGDAAIETADPSEILREAQRKIPRETIRWMANRLLTHRTGNVLFVHAGIRPGVALEEQRPNDLLWIRDEFLDCEADHTVLVVHGHSIRELGPEIKSNRIGIDTGAYRTGRLTALAMEDNRYWTLSTQPV
jgi:serine/threonine protein phosphatase 1